MAKDRPPKKSGSDAAGDSKSPLERYLEKQKADKPTRSEREIAKATVKQSALEAAKAAGRSLFNSGANSGANSGGASKSQTQGGAPTPPASKIPAPEVRKPVLPKTPPSLHGIERPPMTEKPQPSSLGRWESFGDKAPGAENRSSSGEIDDLAASVPSPPPAANRTDRFDSQATQTKAQDQDFPITDSNVDGDHLRPGQFGARFVAYMIDVLILGCLSIPVRSFASAVAAIFFGSSAATHALTSDTVVYLVLVYAYFGYFYSTKGASPGKLMLNLKVTELDGKTKLTPWKAFFREALGKWISGVPFAMGYIIVLLRSDRRALHDLLFDTRVVVNTDRRP